MRLASVYLSVDLAAMRASISPPAADAFCYAEGPAALLVGPEGDLAPDEYGYVDLG